MSDNIETLCSSKVSPIKSTHSSADKPANVKMVKKHTFLNLTLIFYVEIQTVSAVLTDPGYHGRWSDSLSSITSRVEGITLLRLAIEWLSTHTQTNTNTLPDTRVGQFERNSLKLLHFKL